MDASPPLMSGVLRAIIPVDQHDQCRLVLRSTQPPLLAPRVAANG